MQPSFETLRDLIRACGLELHFALDELHESQDPAIERALALTPDERLAQLEAWTDFLVEAREGATRARG